LLSLWCIFFFRDPHRVAPEGSNLVVSPADGVVKSISQHSMPSELKSNVIMQRVSIFLNIFNVHVNRIPISGRVDSLYYRHGKFLNASLDKASIDNERQTVLLSDSYGNQIVLVQIAGIIARRIICNLKEEEKVKQSDRYGIIKFGSRVDLYLPMKMKIQIKVGQTMVGGETIIGELNECITREMPSSKKELKTSIELN
jgi:phosphatidylserine decarboxylase